MPYQLVSPTYQGLNIILCAMVSQDGANVVNVTTSGETILPPIGSEAGGDRQIHTTDRDWGGTGIAGTFEGYVSGAGSETWDSEGLFYDRALGSTCFIAVNDGVKVGSTFNGYNLCLQMDNNTGQSNSGFGWDGSRVATMSNQGPKSVSTITLPAAGKCSIGYYYGNNDPDSGYWHVLGDDDVSGTSMQDQGVIWTEFMPAYTRRLQGWDGQGNAAGDIALILFLEGKFTDLAAGFEGLQNDWPGTLLGLAPGPVGGYKPLLQRSDLGNSLYDGTIL